MRKFSLERVEAYVSARKVNLKLQFPSNIDFDGYGSVLCHNPESAYEAGLLSAEEHETLEQVQVLLREKLCPLLSERAHWFHVCLEEYEGQSKRTFRAAGSYYRVNKPLGLGQCFTMGRSRGPGRVNTIMNNDKDDFKKQTDEPAFTIRLTKANDDWLRAARLKRSADQGDKAAAAELERMESATLEQVEDKGSS